MKIWKKLIKRFKVWQIRRTIRYLEEYKKDSEETERQFGAFYHGFVRFWEIRLEQEHENLRRLEVE